MKPVTRKVLLVDAHAFNRKLLRLILEGEGFRTLEASDRLEALRILERQPVDAILSDISKPQVDGYRLRLRHVFLGRWMRYGGYYPDLKLRLFRRVTSSGIAHFTDRPVHESVTVTGRVETMTKDFLHHGYPNLEIYLEHMNRYSTLGARIVAAKGKVSRSLSGPKETAASSALISEQFDFLPIRFGPARRWKWICVPSICEL